MFRSMMRAMYHKPVLLHESVDGLRVRPGGVYVDVTFGGGGHSREILARLEGGRLVAFDQDEDALGNAPQDDRLLLLHNNFRHLKKFLRLHQVEQVDGVLADLGVSSHQIDQEGRGFSTRFNAELDMRMDQRRELTAKQIINEYTLQQLVTLFRTYGELNNAGRVAALIVSARANKCITYVEELKSVLASCVDSSRENKFFAKVFQALRIEVNNEMGALEDMLVQSLDVLKSGGRLVVISYHSLEDRLVKNFFRSGNLEGRVEQDFYGNLLTPFKVISRKVIMASAVEVQENNRSRSARLRIAEKLPVHG